MAIVLAPMEGLLDFVLRDILTRVGGIDRCVSEFIRVTNTLLPERAFVRVVPELLTGGRTLAGIPVRPQLLGSDPSCLADNAARVAGLGADGVDLNFGCPAKVVNRHGGGAALLEDPELLFKIVSAVRRAVPGHQVVSAKMRLGFHDDRRAEECALALEAGGADEIAVHARTRADAYRPPAYWGRIADIAAVVRTPLVANGEIWNVHDALACRAESGCQTLMLGRGIVSYPGLAHAIIHSGSPDALRPRTDWAGLAPHIAAFWGLVRNTLERRQQAGRLKQWLNFLRRHYPEAQVAYDALKAMNDVTVIDAWV
ncbi:MAG: tRNA-dihydrouridine synthase, partial [Rhodoferax sp.]|nr:tRNA-dihydrouridine synthase [Rhodoferax sp.]